MPLIKVLATWGGGQKGLGLVRKMSFIASSDSPSDIQDGVDPSPPILPIHQSSLKATWGLFVCLMRFFYVEQGAFWWSRYFKLSNIWTIVSHHA